MDESIVITPTGEEDIWFDEGNDDYYFSDETEQLHGPYETMVEALDALDKYGEWLNGNSAK